MKKLSTFVVLLVCCLSLCLGGTSRLYDSMSIEYQRVRKLCLMTGDLGPTSASPMTESELYRAYLRIDKSKLDERSLSEYEELGEIFEDEEKPLDFVVSINPFLYETTLKDTLDNEEFILPYRKMPAFIEYGLKASFGDFAFLEMYLEEANMERIDVLDSDKNVVSSYQGVYDSSFDLFLKHQNGKWYSYFDGIQPVYKFQNTPTIARGAISNEFTSLILGRTKQELGGGYTGNLVLSDNFRYQEMLGFAFFNDEFNYRLNLTHFDPQRSDEKYDTSYFSGKQNERLVHRIEMSLGRRFRAAVNLGLMIYAERGFDIRHLTPMMFVHNWYNFSEDEVIRNSDEANNVMSFELEALPFDGFRISGQAIIDQITQIGEEVVNVPNALGFLANASYLKSHSHFDAEYFMEAYYSTPSLYLNKKKNDDMTWNWNYDWVVGYAREGVGDAHYSGHPYGPDTIMSALGVNLDFSDIDLRSENILEYKISGSQAKNRNTVFSFDKKSPTGICETRLSLRSYNSLVATESLSIHLDFGMSHYKNFRYNEGENKTLFQLAFGVKWEII